MSDILTGKVISAGTITTGCETIDGLLVEIPRQQLANFPHRIVYADVCVTLRGRQESQVDAMADLRAIDARKTWKELEATKAELALEQGRTKELEEQNDKLTKEMGEAYGSLFHVVDQLGAVARDLVVPKILNTRRPVVLNVDERPGIMEPDTAAITLRSGHVLEVGDEGVTVWPSLKAQCSGENSQVLGGLTFCKTEAQP